MNFDKYDSIPHVHIDMFNHLICNYYNYNQYDKIFIDKKTHKDQFTDNRYRNSLILFCPFDEYYKYARIIFYTYDNTKKIRHDVCHKFPKIINDGRQILETIKQNLHISTTSFGKSMSINELNYYLMKFIKNKYPIIYDELKLRFI